MLQQLVWVFFSLFELQTHRENSVVSWLRVNPLVQSPERYGHCSAYLMMNEACFSTFTSCCLDSQQLPAQVPTKKEPKWILWSTRSANKSREVVFMIERISVNKSCSELLDGQCGLGVFTLAVWYHHKEESGMIQYSRFLEIFQEMHLYRWYYIVKMPYSHIPARRHLIWWLYSLFFFI